MMHKLIVFTLLMLMQVSNFTAYAYPVDGYSHSMIRRLLRLQLIENGKIKEKGLLEGQKLGMADVKLRLTGPRGDSLAVLPGPDPGLQKALEAMFPVMHESYSITVLDITEGKPLRFAKRHEMRGFQPGSVGKLAVLAGFFTELQRIYPDSEQDRTDLMCNKVVRAGKWALPNIHLVPFFNPETNAYSKRLLVENDMFTLFEWLDHMISVSSNGAASVVWRETVLMRAFGKDYPTLTPEQAQAYFKDSPKAALRTMAMAVVADPLRTLAITEQEFRVGSFFTAGAKAMIPGDGGSTGTPNGLMKYLIALERGKIVDVYSSLEIKRLLYSTDRRIRYASASVLNNAAVFFKSGSLYKCAPETGYACEKYKGNVENYMNSIAIVEHPDGTTYMVALMSNVLRRNSGSDHMSLAARIEKMIRG